MHCLSVDSTGTQPLLMCWEPLSAQCKVFTAACCNTHQGYSALLVESCSSRSALQTTSWQFASQTIPAGPRHGHVTLDSALEVPISSMQQEIKAPNSNHACWHLNMEPASSDVCRHSQLTNSLASLCSCRHSCMCSGNTMPACTQDVSIHNVAGLAHSPKHMIIYYRVTTVWLLTACASVHVTKRLDTPLTVCISAASSLAAHAL